MWPKRRLHFGEEQDGRVVEYCRNLESAHAWQDVEVRDVVVHIGDQLAVDLLLVPGLWHFVHDAGRAGDYFLDGLGCVGEEFEVARLVVPRVPPVRLAIDAHFKNER